MASLTKRSALNLFGDLTRLTGIWVPVAVALVALPACAQETGIEGRVNDPSGAVMAAVNVSATGADGLKFSTRTNPGGLYQFPTLRAGSYVLRFEIAGFTPAERTLSLL